MSDEPRQCSSFDYPPAGTTSPSGVVPADIPMRPDGITQIDTRKPIPFDRHSFGVECFDSYGCKVRYAEMLAIRQPDDEPRPSPASQGKCYPKLMNAWIISDWVQKADGVLGYSYGPRME